MCVCVCVCVCVLVGLHSVFDVTFHSITTFFLNPTTGEITAPERLLKINDRFLASGISKIAKEQETQ